MAQADARPVPRKNQPFRLYFSVRYGDGTLPATWSGATSQISKDGLAYTTGPVPVYVGHSSGYVDLTATQMNADSVVVYLLSGTGGALATILTLYPEEKGDYRVDDDVVASGVWQQASTDMIVAGTFGQYVESIYSNQNSSTDIAGAVWNALTASYGDVGTYGALVETNLDAAITSRSTHDAAAVYTAFGNGSNLSDVGLSTTALNNVNIEADLALTDYDAPTNTEMVAAFTEIKGATWTTGDELTNISTIAADVGGLGGDVMRGTDGAALASTWTSARGVKLDDILTDTAELVTDLNAFITDVGANGAGLTNIPTIATVSTVTGSVTVGTISAGAIDSNAIAADAIGSSEFSQAAADKVWDTLLSGHVNTGSTGQALVAASGSTTTPSDIWGYVGTRSLTTQDWSKHDAAAVYTAFGNGSNLSDVGLSTTALNNINAEVDIALNTAIPTTTTVDSINERVAAIDTKLIGTIQAGSHNPQTGDTYGVVTDATYGNSAIRTQGDSAWTTANLTTVNTVVDSIKLQTDLLNFTGADVNATLGSELVTLANVAHGGTSATLVLSDYGNFDGTTANNPNVLLDTTISSVTNTTTFVLSAGSDQDNAYNGQAFVVYDVSNSNYPSVRVVSTYVGATKTITIDSAPAFTVVALDGVKLFVTAPGTTAPTAGEVSIAVWDRDITLHTNADSTGQALITASGNYISGDWATATSVDTIDNKANILVSGVNVTALNSDVVVTVDSNTIAQETATAVWSATMSDYDAPTTTGLTLISASGNISTGSVESSGLATTAQLEYWGLAILNSFGGG